MSSSPLFLGLSVPALLAPIAQFNLLLTATSLKLLFHSFAQAQALFSPVKTVLFPLCCSANRMRHQLNPSPPSRRRR